MATTNLHTRRGFSKWLAAASVAAAVPMPVAASPAAIDWERAELELSAAWAHVAWAIGDCIIKAGGPYKELYNMRKEYEAPRVETKMHAHNRAKRYMEKRILRDLWIAWRRGPLDDC